MNSRSNTWIYFTMNSIFYSLAVTPTSPFLKL